MNRSWWYRFSFMLLLFIISVMAVIPTFFGLKEDSSFPVKSKINLGLDLQGGLYMVLGIDFNKVYSDEVKNYLKKVESVLVDEGIQAEFGKLNSNDVTDPKHSIIITNPTQVEQARDKVREYFGTNLRITEIQSCAGLEQLKNLRYIQIKREKISKSFYNLFSFPSILDFFSTPNLCMFISIQL